MLPSDTIPQHLQELELCLLQPSVRTSARVEELLAEEFIEIGSSGNVHTRHEIISALQAEPTTHWTATQFRIRLLAPTIALVTFRAHRHSEPPVHSLRSSIWKETNGRWQMYFHQGTLTAAER
jgi:hypothetical protein